MKRYSKLQTCPLVILYSISANSPSKQQGGRHIVIGAMGSVDRVITLGGGGGGVGNRRPGSYIPWKSLATIFWYVGVWTTILLSKGVSSSNRNHLFLFFQDGNDFQGFISIGLLNFVTHPFDPFWKKPFFRRKRTRIKCQGAVTSIDSERETKKTSKEALEP